MIENNEHLLVSCPQCKTIWFCDIDSGNFSEALDEDWFFPGLMHKGEGDYILIVNSRNGPIPILKVKCTPAELIIDYTEVFYSRMEGITFMCYLPNVKCVALSDWEKNVVKAIHCETCELIWEVKGEVGGVIWMPHGLCYSPEHQSLLVCDPIDDSRVVV